MFPADWTQSPWARKQLAPWKEEFRLSLPDSASVLVVHDSTQEGAEWEVVYWESLNADADCQYHDASEEEARSTVASLLTAWSEMQDRDASVCDGCGQEADTYQRPDWPGVPTSEGHTRAPMLCEACAGVPESFRPTPFVVAAISRMSPSSRAALRARLLEKVSLCEDVRAAPSGQPEVDALEAREEARALAVLGRFEAITAGIRE